jgi:hypothetical protein
VSHRRAATVRTDKFVAAAKKRESAISISKSKPKPMLILSLMNRGKSNLGINRKSAFDPSLAVMFEDRSRA